MCKRCLTSFLWEYRKSIMNASFELSMQRSIIYNAFHRKLKLYAYKMHIVPNSATKWWAATSCFCCLHVISHRKWAWFSKPHHFSRWKHISCEQQSAHLQTLGLGKFSWRAGSRKKQSKNQYVVYSFTRYNHRTIFLC